MNPLRFSRRITVLWSLAGVASMVWYFGWLLTAGVAGVPVLFGLLVLADAFNGFHALSFWATALRGPKERPFVPPPQDTRVDVLVPTYNEPAEILKRTVRAARRIRGAHVRVWLLDDGDRAEVADLARLLGVHYLAREDHQGAKSGNLNHALAATAPGGAPYVAVFDADHVPARGFLEQTLGYFADPDVALVQTPQVYANVEAGPLTRAAAEQQAIFFGPICVGKDGWDSAFCCGTNFVARRDRLEAVGNFPEDSITEDIVLSMRLIARGWSIAYLGRPLAWGLGPEDAGAYFGQQRRWAAGCLDLLLRRPGAWRGLSWAQRWQFTVATSYWLTGWTLLVYLSLPVVRLVFDAPVLVASANSFVVHFLPYFLLAIVSLGRFTIGAYSINGLALNWGCFWVHVRATVAVLAGRPGSFAVTPKHARPGVMWRVMTPNLVVAGVLLAACGYGLAQGVTPAVLGNVSFALLDAGLATLVVGFAVVQARRVAPVVPDEVSVPVPLQTGRFDRAAIRLSTRDEPAVHSDGIERA